MSNLTPEQIFNKYQSGKIDRASALTFFKSFMENSDEEVEQLARKIGRKFIEKAGIDASEAMVLRFLEILFDSKIYLEITQTYISMDTGVHDSLDFYIENGHVIGINACDFPLDFSIIKFFKHIKRLYINIWFAGSQDLSGIGDLSNLEILKLKWAISGIVEIGLLPKLKELSLIEVPVDDLNFVRDLINLEKLSISKIDDSELYNKIREINGLEKLTRLKKLNLRGCSIEEIKGLEKLVNLEKLDLSCNNIKEIKGLESLVNLKSINLYDNPIVEEELKYVAESPQKIVEYCRQKRLK